VESNFCSFARRVGTCVGCLVQVLQFVLSKVPAGGPLRNLSALRIASGLCTKNYSFALSFGSKDNHTQFSKDNHTQSLHLQIYE